MNVVVIGGGRVGSHLAALLLNAGHRVRVIEARRNELAHLQADLASDVVIGGNSTDPSVMEAAGIRQADVAVAVTDRDETNLVVSSLARFEFNVPRIIARINDPRNAWMFTPEMGVDVALNQASLMAHLVAEEMSLGDMMTLLKLRKGRFSLVEEKMGSESPSAQKAVRDLDLPAGCVLVAVIRSGELIIPRGGTVLQPGDEILAVVHASEAGRLAAVLGSGGNEALV